MPVILIWRKIRLGFGSAFSWLMIIFILESFQGPFRDLSAIVTGNICPNSSKIQNPIVFVSGLADWRWCTYNSVFEVDILFKGSQWLFTCDNCPKCSKIKHPIFFVIGLADRRFCIRNSIQRITSAQLQFNSRRSCRPRFAVRWQIHSLISHFNLLFWGQFGSKVGTTKLT